jgi:hypothetical protein
MTITDEEQVYEQVDFSQLRPIAEPLVQLLPDALRFYPSINFREMGAMLVKMITYRLQFSRTPHRRYPSHAWLCPAWLPGVAILSLPPLLVQ